MNRLAKELKLATYSRCVSAFVGNMESFQKAEKREKELARLFARYRNFRDYNTYRNCIYTHKERLLYETLHNSITMFDIQYRYQTVETELQSFFNNAWKKEELAETEEKTDTSFGNLDYDYIDNDEFIF